MDLNNRNHLPKNRLMQLQIVNNAINTHQKLC